MHAIKYPGNLLSPELFCGHSHAVEDDGEQNQLYLQKQVQRTPLQPLS